MLDEQSSGWSERVEAVYINQGRELWALFYAHCVDADRAHDALQEAFTRLQEQNGAPIRDMRAWLLRVGRNWLRDVARRKSSSTRSSEHLEELAVSQQEASTIIEQREVQSLVRDALAQLRNDDREVLVLRYSMGWSSNRIAEALSSTASAVDMRLSRARRRLGNILKRSGVGHESL